MLVFWKARLVLLAVPKTGSTALEGSLATCADAAIVNPPGLKHCSARRYRRDLAPFFERGVRDPFELVAVVREPTDWLGSWWRYRGRDALVGHENCTRDHSFDAFVQAHLRATPPPFADVGSQARLLDGGVDRLFRYEDFDGLIRFLECRLDRTFAFERVNVSPPGEAVLSDGTARALHAARAADFTLWKSLSGDPSP